MILFVVLGVYGEYFYFFLLYFAWKFLEANSVDTDQTPRVAAFDLNLHCLHDPLKRVPGVKRVKGIRLYSFGLEYAFSVNSLNTKKADDKIFVCKLFFKKLFSSSYIILRLQRLWDKQCRSR